MKTALAIFAKEPGISPVKTRLAMDFGKENAELFYRMSVEAVEEIAQKARELSGNSIDLYWAMPEKPVTGQRRLCSFPVLWTGEGGLGKGLYNISASLFVKYKQVIMIGTDSPQLEESLILEAVNRLETKPQECVAGPCPDGGFYLFGSARAVPGSIWTSVPYSRSDTLRILSNKLIRAGFSYSLLPQVADMDQLEDLQVLSDIFAAREVRLLPAQRKLYSWLSIVSNSGLRGYRRVLCGLRF